jgi:hypothetical protein
MAGCDRLVGPMWRTDQSSRAKPSVADRTLEALLCWRPCGVVQAPSARRHGSPKAAFCSVP